MCVYGSHAGSYTDSYVDFSEAPQKKKKKQSERKMLQKLLIVLQTSPDVGLLKQKNSLSMEKK